MPAPLKPPHRRVEEIPASEEAGYSNFFALHRQPDIQRTSICCSPGLQTRGVPWILGYALWPS
jgi:hypothetical protein